MEWVAWMVPFARRVRTIRMCSLDARGLGPIQATLWKARHALLRPCQTAFLSTMRKCSPVVRDMRAM